MGLAPKAQCPFTVHAISMLAIHVGFVTLDCLPLDVPAISWATVSMSLMRIFAVPRNICSVCKLFWCLLESGNQTGRTPVVLFYPRHRQWLSYLLYSLCDMFTSRAKCNSLQVPYLSCLYVGKVRFYWNRFSSYYSRSNQVYIRSLQRRRYAQAFYPVRCTFKISDVLMIFVMCEVLLRWLGFSVNWNSSF